MSGVPTLLGLWLGVTFASVAGLLWVANRETVAELPDAPVPHDPAACEVCCWASDVGVIAAIDWALWAAECQERTS